MAQAITTASVSICEIGDHWEVRWPLAPTEVFGTGAEALAAIRGFGESLSRLGVSNALVVTWEPRSRVGRQIVRALT